MPLGWAVPTLGRKYPLKWVSTAVQRGTWGRRVMNLCTSWITAFVNGMFLRSSYVTQLPALTVLPISSCTFYPSKETNSPSRFDFSKKKCVFPGSGGRGVLKHQKLTLDLWVFHHQQDGPLQRGGRGLCARHDQVKYGCY